MQGLAELQAPGTGWYVAGGVWPLAEGVWRAAEIMTSVNIIV